MKPDDPHAAAITASRAEREEQLAEALAALPAAREAAKAAKSVAEAADQEFQNLNLRVIRALRSTDATAPAVRELLEEVQRTRDHAAAAETRAKLALSNLLWRASCLRDDIEQLDQVLRPPPVTGPVREVVKRPPPPGPQAIDPIEFPRSHMGGEAA